MALLPAIGLGVAIIVLRVLAPGIWHALEHFTLQLLAFGSGMLDYLQAAVGASSLIPLSR